jgi:molybdate transport system substrate-binding protein
MTSLEKSIEQELSIDLQLSFSSSSIAARQVVEGAPADLLITADAQSMELAGEEEVVERPTLLARNRLALIVENRNPKGISGLGDLSRPELNVVLCDPAVPCGRLAAGLLEKAGITPAIDSLEENVGAAVGKVALGQADVTVGYVTDVKSRPDLQQVAADETASDDFAAEYLAAVVRASSSRAEARRLVELLQSPAIQTRFVAAGFLIEAG